LKFIEKLGYNPQEDLIEVYPIIHTMTGGIRINDRCETNVPGLYAAGQAAFAVGDCLGEGATGITDSLVWGKRAGEYAAKYALRTEVMGTADDKISVERNRVFAPLKRKDGVPPITIMRRIQHTMWTYLGLVKNEQGMLKAKQILNHIRRIELPKIYVKAKTSRGNFEMAEALETNNMLITSELLTASSLFRKESRNRFIRDDYPKRDDENWLKHIIIKKEEGKIKISTIPVEFPYIKHEDTSPFPL
jgi:succinate dehydrogenase/fumarate reductase flavoprotein subunit